MHYTQDSFVEKTKQFIDKYKLLKPNSIIIVGLSAGPDSVALLHVLHALQSSYNLTIYAAYLDHEWRSDTDQDIELCSQLCKYLNVHFIHKRASYITLNHRCKTSSKEEHGRYLRQTFFKDLKHSYNADVIALAHHLDDQQETFFIKLIRGASIRGLACMKPCSSPYIRPFLCHTKDDIISYLSTHNIPYIVDSTNKSFDFLRNRIRHTVIPALKDVDSRFDKNFHKTLTHIQHSDSFINDTLHTAYQEVTYTKNGILYLDIKKLFSHHTYTHIPLIESFLCSYKVFFKPSHAFFNEMIRFLKSPRGGVHTLYASWNIIKKNNIAHIKLI
jgi:tRNA(Ile)-lysidine synthase